MLTKPVTSQFLAKITVGLSAVSAENEHTGISVGFFIWGSGV